MPPKCWLMKAEPDSRIEKGKEVKFSVDDFESVKTTPWEGVRNHEAKNLMKDMKCGDKVLFYHSNCKVPGIAAFAEVLKEAHPDYTAWDPEHPYYDAKTDEENPKWFMVEVTFVSRAKHFVPLALLRHIADSSTTKPPSELDYIGEKGIHAIKEMALVNRGRLSVQRVEGEAWDVIDEMAQKGGWEDMEYGKGKGKGKEKAKKAHDGEEKGGGKKEKRGAKKDSEDASVSGETETKTSSIGRKRKAVEKDEDPIGPTRRSTRARK